MSSKSAVERVQDINGNQGIVVDRWHQGPIGEREWWVRVRFDKGGERSAPEGCFRAASPVGGPR